MNTQVAALAQNERKQQRKQIISYLLKAGLVAALLYFLAKKGFISLNETKRAFSHWDLVGPGIAGLLFTSLLGVVRWQWLLRAHDIDLSWGKVFQLTYIGNFFNIALPGAVSGDFVKAFYLGKQLPGVRAKAFGAILFDRVAGLSALAILSATALLVGFESFRGTVLMVALRFAITLAAICVIAFYAYLFLVREKHDPLLLLFKAIEKRVPKAGSLTRVYAGIRHYHSHRWVVVKVLLLSIFIHAVVGWSFLNFVRAFGDDFIGLMGTYVVVPLGLLVTAVPVMPAGVGTGHAAFLYLFHLMGSQRGADVFTLSALVTLLIGGFGGIIYLRYRAHAPKLPEEAETPLEG